MSRAILCVLFVVGLSAACSSGSSSQSASAAGSGSFSGTLGGEAFVFTSGVGSIDKEGSLSLIMSDSAGVCESLGQRKFHAGETVVQAYGLKGTAPGVFKPEHDDVKYASVSPTCASGQSIEGSVDKKGRATKSEFTIARLTATEVEGKLSVTYDDGSSISGTFTVPICVTKEAEGATCY